MSNVLKGVKVVVKLYLMQTHIDARVADDFCHNVFNAFQYLQFNLILPKDRRQMPFFFCKWEQVKKSNEYFTQ